MLEKCKLCLKHSNLCKSHAIPDSLFKKIFRANNGKAIELSSIENEEIKHSQDSWATTQLCEGCERKLNQHYESYGMLVLSGKKALKSQDESGIILSDFNTRKFRDFLASILWRMSESSHPSFSNVNLPPKIQQSIRSGLNTKTELSKGTFLVRGFRLIDSTENGFSEKDLRDFIVSPFVRTDYSLNHNQIGQAICFCFTGFLFEFFISARPTSKEYHQDFIGFNKKCYKFCFQEITKVPELFDLMLLNFAKQKEGLSRIKS